MLRVQVKAKQPREWGKQISLDAMPEVCGDAEIEQTADQLTANGRVALEQTAFGIIPFSILGGALQVQDRVDVRFVIHARRMPS